MTCPARLVVALDLGFWGGQKQFAIPCTKDHAKGAHEHLVGATLLGYPVKVLEGGKPRIVWR